MTKRPMHNLGKEHGDIEKILKVMGKVAAKLRNGEEVNRKHLVKMVEFIRNFADKCHHGKEEGILFPELVKNPRHSKTINEWLGEHKTGRDYIRGITESLKTYKKGNPEAYHIAVNAQGYIQLLTEHINKENTLFYKLDKELPESLQAKLEARFETLEKEITGAGKLEIYHSWLQELQEIYLA